MHEYSVELSDNFVVKPKQSLAESIQVFVFYWHFVNFLITFTQ